MTALLDRKTLRKTLMSSKWQRRRAGGEHWVGVLEWWREDRWGRLGIDFRGFQRAVKIRLYISEYQK